MKSGTGAIWTAITNKVTTTRKRTMGINQIFLDFLIRMNNCFIDSSMVAFDGKSILLVLYIKSRGILAIAVNEKVYVDKPHSQVFLFDFL